MRRLLVISLVSAVAVLLPPGGVAGGAEPLSAWNAALANAGTSQANVVYLGSSTTYGAGASTLQQRYVNVLTDRMRGGALEVVPNAGSSYPTRNTAPGVHGYLSAAGGTTSASYVDDSTRPLILWEEPSLIVHMIGSNDSVDTSGNGVPVEQYEVNVGAEVDRLTSGSPKAVSHLLIHTYRRAGVSMAKWATYREALERIAAARSNVSVLDISPYYESADHMGADPLDLIGSDGIHQTDAGHAYMARLIGDYLLGASTPVPTPIPSPSPPPASNASSSTVTPAPSSVVGLAAPRKLRAIRDGRTIRLNWRPVTDARRYRVRCGRTALSVIRTRAVVRSTANTCRVRARAPLGTSPWTLARVQR